MKNFKRITKRGLSLFIALMMCMSVMSLTAFAAENSPSIDDVYIDVADNSTDNGNFIMAIPKDTYVTGITLEVTASQPFQFVETTNPVAGDLYVSSVGDNSSKLNFNVTYRETNMNDPQYALTMTSTDNTIWTGTFEGITVDGETLGFGTMTIDVLAAALRTQGSSLKVAAGVMGGTSQARRLLVNEDAQNVSLILCVPDATVYEVTYDVPNGDNIVWSLVSGMSMLKPNLTTDDQQTVTWYADEARTVELAADATVTGNTTIYAKISSTGESGDFLTDLKSETGTATIKNLTDWETFAAHSAEAPKGKLVILAADIDCGGKTYPALTFNGSFNGYSKGETDTAAKVHKISNAKFTKVDSAYIASSETGITSCGLFNRIIDGQTVANLVLENITAQDYNATYSAPLAGIVDGTNNSKARIQNVQTIGCKTQGRTAGGVIGFLRNGTIEFCSSQKGTSSNINGLANGAGIVGINSAGNALVINCFCKDITPTALTFMSGVVGGVVSKNLRGAKAECCWSTYATPVGNNEAATNCYGAVNSSTSFAGFSSEYWNINGAQTDFIADKIICTNFNTNP